MAESEFTKRIASKLVRDKIPGDQTVWPDKALHYTLLVAKLSEEAAEVARCNTNEELVEELADVFEACMWIGYLRGISASEIAAVGTAKFMEKGGFERGVVQTGITDMGEQPGKKS